MLILYPETFILIAFKIPQAPACFYKLSNPAALITVYVTVSGCLHDTVRATVCERPVTHKTEITLWPFIEKDCHPLFSEEEEKVSRELETNFRFQ